MIAQELQQSEPQQSHDSCHHDVGSRCEHVAVDRRLGALVHAFRKVRRDQKCPAEGYGYVQRIE
jgi:VanZ family protein